MKNLNFYFNDQWIYGVEGSLVQNIPGVSAHVTIEGMLYYVVRVEYDYDELTIKVFLLKVVSLGNINH